MSEESEVAPRQLPPVKEEPRPLPKRFWRVVTLGGSGEATTVLLDGRALKTPAKNPFVAPRAVAAVVAEEWANAAPDVGAPFNPELMPTTRAVNTAIDRIAHHRAAVVAEIAGYGGSDLLCYRADGPAALVARQARVWDPLLDWAAARFGARLRVTHGLMPVQQDAAAVAALRVPVAAASDLGLAALHDLVGIAGSLVIALAVTEGRLDADAAWQAARIDEDWNAELWGQDAEALAAARHKRAAFDHAARLWALVHPRP